MFAKFMDKGLLTMIAVALLKSIQDTITGLGRIGQKLRSTVKERRKETDRRKEKKQLSENPMNLLHTDAQSQNVNDSDKFPLQQEEKPEISSDMFLDVPQIKSDEIKLTLEDLDARVALQAELAGMVKINVGVSAGIRKLDLDIKGLDLKALLKVKLKNVKKIFNRALESLDKNPDILKDMSESSGSGKSKKVGSFFNEKRSTGNGTKNENDQNNKKAENNFESEEGKHKEIEFDDKSFNFSNQQKNSRPEERNDTRDGHESIIKEKKSDKTYEEVEKKKNGVEKITKVVLSSGLADGGNTETSVAGIKQAIEGRSSVRKNGVFRFFRLNRCL
jgi:hypothetical protein